MRLQCCYAYNILFCAVFFEAIIFCYYYLLIFYSVWPQSHLMLSDEVVKNDGHVKSNRWTGCQLPLLERIYKYLAKEFLIVGGS